MWWFRALQVVVLAGAAYYLARVAAPHWPAIRSRDLAWRLGPLAASAVLVLATLSVLLAAWTASLLHCSPAAPGTDLRLVVAGPPGAVVTPLQLRAASAQLLPGRGVPAAAPLER